jgi:ABC-2 type transport system permease protein
MKLINRLLESRFWALAVKESNQTLKNKQLLFLFIFTPTVYLMIFGFTFNPDVHDLNLGIVDYDNTLASRELVYAFTENDVFIASSHGNSEQTLSQQVQTGQVTAGLVIPPEFSRYLHQGRTAKLQVFIDAVNANTAGIASSYITQIVNYYSRQQDLNRAPAVIQPKVTFLYNPGLLSGWFSVPAALAVVMTLTSSLASTNSVVIEKNAGTLEQLLMTPATAWEILLAKVVPLFVLLIGDVILGLSVGNLIFGVPFRGNFILFLALSSVYILIGAGIGILLATISRSQLQALLTSFFINLPLIQLSGAIAPIESMPLLFQYLSLLNPLRHYVAIVRSLLLKGVGLDVLSPNAIALSLFATILLTISINRFRTLVGAYPKT